MIKSNEGAAQPNTVGVEIAGNRISIRCIPASEPEYGPSGGKTMCKIRCWRLAVVILSGSLNLILSHPARAVEAGKTPEITAQVTPPSNATYPQIVRIRYMEGDVRVARGKQDEKAGGSTWEQAVAGLPLATGFNLVTGTGRAEIEFEDASTVYLAENSALTFNDIHTTGGVPFTVIALLSGTATMCVQPEFPTEEFEVKTPTGSVSAAYPNETFVRITGFVDGKTLKFLRDTTVYLLGSTRPVQYSIGETVTTRVDSPVALADSKAPDALAAWDTWVSKRVATRLQAQSAMLQASGLKEPIPGLTDMDGHGTFFPCAPYGTCWEPVDDSAPVEAGTAVPATRPAAMPARQAVGAAPAAQSAVAHPVDRFEQDTFLPCLPDEIRTLVERDRVTGKERVVWTRTEAIPGVFWGIESWDWAVCHAGFWIYRTAPNGRHRYVWVVNRRRHHHPPVRWFKPGPGRKVAFVPLHPRDVAGTRPVNLKHEAFQVGGKGRSMERVTLEPGRQIQVLNSPPKEFNKPFFAPLAHAEEPRVEVHNVGEPLVASKDKGPALTFDHRSQSFLIARQVTLGNKTITVLAPFEGATGGLQARVQGVDSHGSYSTRPSGGESGRSEGGFAENNGGSRGSGPSAGAGAGSRGSGGSSGGGEAGGSHGGGGGSSGGGGGSNGGGGVAAGGGAGGGGSSGGSGHH
jgi:hypothetical protein